MKLALTIAAGLVLSSASAGLGQPQLANQLSTRVGDVVSISTVITGYVAPAGDSVSCLIVTFADVPFVRSPNVLLTTSSVSATASAIWVDNRRLGLCVGGAPSSGAPLDIFVMIQGAVPAATTADAGFHLLATPVGSLDELQRLRNR